jgi:glycosyltransferase involved in cell wall biosynthesis
MKKRLPKVAIIHDWLTGMRGGEKVLDVLCELFPQADLFTLVHIHGSVSPRIEAMKTRTSFLQKIPGIQSRYRQSLPLMPWAVRQFNLSGYDFILSSSHCVAKGVRIPPGTVHLCYCHTPMRYVWDRFDDYFAPGKSSLPARWTMRLLRPVLQGWDRRTAQNVTGFIANSENVRRRIRKHYDRDATVIYPPIDTAYFTSNGRSRKDFFLIVTAFAPYKRIEVAIEAFNRLRIPLVIAGQGQEYEKLAAIASPHIKLLGWVPDETLKSLYREAQALIFPGEEDFGMVPLEAQACGCPVIALARGGALESVIPGETGLFFSEPTPEALSDCVGRFRSQDFDPSKTRANALRFTTEVFRKKFMDHLTHFLPGFEFEFAQ